MKTYFKLLPYAYLLAAVMAFTSCQNEEPFQVDIDQEQTLSAGSAEVGLMKQTVSNDGSYDNIVDRASCFDIQFPYAVEVNGLAITIEAMEDLKEIEELLDAVDDNEDIMEISFPITVTMADYTEVTLNGVEDLHQIAEQCVEGGDDIDIECIDIVYPITLFTFNPNLQQTGNVTVNEDKELRRFFAGLQETDLISVDFPVSFELFDGTEISVTTNSELADALERAKETCDEDDDNDHNDDDFTEEQLNVLLVKCPWSINKLERMSLDSSEQYGEYLLTFSEDGKVIADNRYGYSIEGEWSTKVSEYRVVLEMEFEDSSDFNEAWYVYEIVEGSIQLFTGDEDKIRLESVCNYQPQACSEEFISEELDTCRWEIANEDGTFFEDLNIDFSNRNIHVHNPNDTVVDEGNWEVSRTTVTFNNLSMTLANYIGEWEVIECSEERFKLQRKDEVIVLDKKCK